MTKFKENDRVKVRFSTHPDKNGWVGKRLTITREDGEFYNNKEAAYVDDESPYRWRESELELVTDEPTTQEAGPVQLVTKPEIVKGEYSVYSVTNVYPDGVNLFVSPGKFEAKHLRQFARDLVSMAEFFETVDDSALSKALREMKE